MTSKSLVEYIRYIQPQENAHCCTACSTLLAAEIILNQNNIQKFFSRLYLYYMTRKIQGRIGQKGADLSSTAEALKKYGVPEERYWPFGNNKIDVEPPVNVINNAVHTRLISYESVPVSEINTYLDNNIPVIVGMRTGRKFWNLTGELQDQMYVPVNNEDNRPTHDHAVTIVGYDNTIQDGGWIIANSLGPKWGFRGYGFIPYSCGFDIGESFSIINFAGYTSRNKM